MTDPAIIEAAARALRDAVSDDGPVRGWQDYSRVATAVLTAVTPLIEAAALERAAKVAEGYKLVPIEPTEEMLRAAGDAFMDAAVGHMPGDLTNVNTPFRRFYRAMLAAASVAEPRRASVQDRTEEHDFGPNRPRPIIQTKDGFKVDTSK